MRIVDLTHKIHSAMPVFPGTEAPVLQKANTLEKDGFREVKLMMYSHTGTHIDAPAHMLEEGPMLDELDIDHFFGRAMILDFTNRAYQEIQLHELLKYEENIRQAEFIIIKTGWSQYWGREEYFQGFPAISEDAAHWLAGLQLKGIGIDAISIDSMTSTTFAVHKILMEQNMIIIENLTNLEALQGNEFILSVLPLRYIEADGSPVRAVALEEI